MQQPNEREFQEHQEKIALIMTTLWKTTWKKLIDNLGWASRSYERLSLYPKFHLRSLNDMELVSELFQHDLDKVSEFWLTDDEKIEMNKLKHALQTDKLDERVYEDEERITETDFTFDGSFSENTPFTNKRGVHSVLCSRDEDYRNCIQAKHDTERSIQNIDSKIKLVCIEISMAVMRFDLLVASAPDLKTLHDIVLQEINFLEWLLFEISDDMSSSNKPRADSKYVFKIALIMLADHMEILHEHIEESICRDRVSHAYDHIQEIALILK